jgi:hypothetical protein
MEKEVAIVDVLVDMEIKNISKYNNDKKVILFHGKTIICRSKKSARRHGSSRVPVNSFLA